MGDGVIVYTISARYIKNSGKFLMRASNVVKVSKKELGRALSSGDIEASGCRFMLYSDLKDIRSLGELRLPVVILYLNTANMGHYVCLFKNRSGINFYDPYNYKPDHEFEFANPRLNFEKGPRGSYLSRLLASSDESFGPITYNEVAMQSSDPAVATCGRHCIVRLRYSQLTQDEYVRFIKAVALKLKITIDELMCFMTR